MFSTEKSFTDLCSIIEINNVIPIIGFDLFNSVFDDQGSDLLTSLAEAYDPEACKQLRSKTDFKNGYDLINSLYHQLPKNKKIVFAKNISDIIVKLRTGIELVPNCFEQLARIKGFRLYINATFLNSLELAINTFKVEKSANKAQPNYEIINYHPRHLKDISYDATTNDFSTLNFEKPTIYNMLGTHDVSEGEYVLTDVHYMELLVKMISNKDQSFSNLKAALKDASLLFIGCDFPDWILRFFLRFCIDTKMDSKEDLERNYIIEQLPDESSKAYLINNYGITKFKIKPNEFVAALYTTLRKRNINNIEKSFYNNHVFISYNHDDKPIAEMIKDQLEEKFIDCWFDITLEAGDDLSPTIKKALDDSCSVIIVLTNNVNKQPGMRRYYKKEWNHVMSTKPKDISVVYSSDYNSWDLHDDIFTKEVKDNIIDEHGDKYIPRIKITSPEYTLDAGFLTDLKAKQYKARISAL